MYAKLISHQIQVCNPTIKKRIITVFYVAFRGFGSPQAMLTTETIVEHVAQHLRLDPFTVRQLNLYQDGDLTHYGQKIEGWNIPRILDQ